MPAMARTLKSYATTEANLVIEVLNQLQWYEQDNLAYSLAANSTDSDLAAFNRALLQKMSSSLSGWFNTLSGDANAKQNNRILKIISPQQNTTTDDKKSVAKKAQEDLILLRTHFNNNLTAGVGSGKPNKKVDVQLVSRGLQAKGYTVASSALNDGLCDDTFIDVIKKFQEEVVGSASPDGAVDAKGATLKKLFDKSNNSYSSGLSNMYGQSASVLNASLEGNPLKTWKRSETFNTATNNYDYTINNTNFLDQETYKQHIEDLAKAKGVEEGSDNANVLGMAAKAASEPEYFNELTKGVGFELNLSQETVGSHQVNSVLKSRLTKFHKFMSAVGLFRGEMSGSACRDAAYAHLISVAHVVMGGVRPAASQQSVRNNLIKVFNGETVAGGSKASNGNILDSDGHVWAKSDHFNKNSAGTATSMKDADWYPHLKTPQPNRNWATLTAEGYERGDTKRFPLGLQATPGRSNHITGDAIDVNSGNFVNKNEAMIDLIALNFGIMRPVPGEQWHFECTNVQLSSSEKSLVDANTRETLSTP